MLEERLSNTYGQLSLGGYQANAPQLSSNMYPSIPTGLPADQRGAESYYTTNGLPQAQKFSRPQTNHNYYPQIQPSNLQQNRAPLANASTYGAVSSRTPQQSYQNFQHPSRAPSLQGYNQSSIAGQDAPYQPHNQSSIAGQDVPFQPYQVDNQYQSFQQQEDPSMQPQTRTPSMPPVQSPTNPPSGDSAAAYYLNSNEQVLYPQRQASQISDRNFSTLAPSPEQPHPDSLRQSQPAPQQQLPPSNTQQSQLPQTPQSSWPQQQPYQYQSPQQTVLPAQSDPQTGFGYPSMNSYTPNSFPSAPQHQPQPKVVEESLIEL